MKGNGIGKSRVRLLTSLDSAYVTTANRTRLDPLWKCFQTPETKRSSTSYKGVNYLLVSEKIVHIGEKEDILMNDDCAF